MLQGQKPPFMLLGRLVDGQGRLARTVRAVMSEGFVVSGWVSGGGVEQAVMS